MKRFVEVGKLGAHVIANVSDPGVRDTLLDWIDAEATWFPAVETIDVRAMEVTNADRA